MIVEGDDSMMFQIPGTEIVGHQAKLSATTWLPIKTQGIEDLEVDELEQSLSNLSIDALVCGALRSDYQKSRIERMCERLEIISYTPLWHQSSLSHITGLVEHGFGVVITSVACDGLDESWLGETLTKQSLAKLIDLSDKFRFNVDGEGGEYETLVVHGPHFTGSIQLEGEKRWLGRRGHFQINKISNSLDGFSG
tara:strand:+ start:50 stop:634 length:585 start_codon:yes stop_codon:yes gene_type:complete